MEHAPARPARGRRRLTGPLPIALVALAVACPSASAQLPGVTAPVEDGGVGKPVPKPVAQVVGGVVNEPLPEPLERVVQDSPVAPVRDEVRRIVNEPTASGGGGSGGSGGSGAGGSAATGGSGGSAGTGDTPGAGNGGSQPRGERPGRGPGRGDASPRRAGARGGRGDAPTPGAGGSRTGSPAPGPRTPAGDRGRERATTGEPGSQGAAIRTIETIVRAIPTPIWIALGLLSLVALVLGVRTFTERRRASALARDRDELTRDVAALERALLPAVPERVGDVATSVAFRPCDGPAAGGDFYDAFELPDGRAAVLVGDVSGHGPEALEATNSVRSQLHALLEAGMSPRAAIATVGEHAPLPLAGRFTTVVVAVHDAATATLTYATAGHPPPIIVGPGAVELLSAGASPPIGVGLRTGLRETRVGLPAGSVACFYTDGLVEARTGGAMIGRSRLAAMVASVDADEEALGVLERVLAEADEAPDDMAVCLVRPLSGTDLGAARVELLELAADDVESGFARRFLDACDVPADDLAVTIEQARAATSADGRALLEVTISPAGGRARVTGEPAAAPPAAV